MINTLSPLSVVVRLNMPEVSDVVPSKVPSKYIFAPGTDLPCISRMFPLIFV